MIGESHQKQFGNWAKSQGLKVDPKVELKVIKYNKC